MAYMRLPKDGQETVLQALRYHSVSRLALRIRRKGGRVLVGALARVMRRIMEDYRVAKID